jgi:hypothetical protein
MLRPSQGNCNRAGGKPDRRPITPIWNGFGLPRAAGQFEPVLGVGIGVAIDTVIDRGVASPYDASAGNDLKF